MTATEEESEEETTKNTTTTEATTATTRTTTIDFSDLQRHCILGTGELANVWLTSHKPTGKTYALKVFDKLHLVEHTAGFDAVKSLNREAQVLLKRHNNINSNFVLQMHQAWQDQSCVYFLLPLIQGGELSKRLYEYTTSNTCSQEEQQHDAETTNSKGLPVEHVRFYSGCIAAALSHMHQQHIAYRDLKPDNCLIDKDGYMVLIDLGFAKVIREGKTLTMCGTPGYVAPEQLKSGNRGAWGKNGHAHYVDWWSWAVVLYELLANATPFQCEGMSDYDTQDAIMIADYACPDYFPELAKDIIDKLLVVDVTQRLGYAEDKEGTSDFTQILTHPWFTSVHFDFEKLNAKQLKAPWIPALKDNLDTSQFYEYNEAEEVHDPYRRLTEEEQKLFEQFAWIP